MFFLFKQKAYDDFLLWDHHNWITEIKLPLIDHYRFTILVASYFFLHFGYLFQVWSELENSEWQDSCYSKNDIMVSLFCWLNVYETQSSVYAGFPIYFGW